MNFTPALLAAACDCTVMTATIWCAPMSVAAARWGIDTPARAAAWLAQVAHESGRFHWVREIWGPTAQQLKYEPPHPLAARLGNTEKGDGFRFLGRGPIQITGRANYRLFRDDAMYRIAGVRDFEAMPEMLEAPKWGAHAAGWFWWKHNLSDFADAGDFETITRRINGGTNGMKDRLEMWAKAKEALGVLE